MQSPNEIFLDRLLKYKDIILYGSALALLMFVLKWLELRLIIVHHAFELYAGAIAVIFTGLGIWLAVKLMQPKTKTVFVETQILVTNAGDFVPNELECRRLGLSKRELEVLQLIADGNTNQEIAGKLFVSLNTIKTHSSRLFEKLEVKSRTQAVEKARRLIIIP